MNPSQPPISPLPSTEQPAGQQPPRSDQPATPPDEKMVQALLATTRAEMEQEGKQRAEAESRGRQGYLDRLLHSPRRLAMLAVITMFSLIVAVVAAKVSQ